MKTNLTIIGGTDGFGKWIVKIANQYFSTNVKITITGRNIEKGKQVSKKLGVNFTDNNIESVKNADIVILACPISKIKEVAKEVGSFTKKDSLIVDISSIKGKSNEILEKAFTNTSNFITCHPMFGPYLKTLAGAVIISTTDKKNREKKEYKFIKNFLENKLAKIIEIDGKTHDKIMAIIQGITHYSMFIIGDTMKKMKFDIELGEEFASPIYKILISSIGRYVGQNPLLYGDVQMFNDENLKAHKYFIKSSKEFAEIVEKKDEQEFIKKIKDINKYFGEEAKAGQTYTDKIIFLLAKQKEKMKESFGKKIKLQNIYSEENIEIIPKKIEGEFVFTKKNSKIKIDEYIIL